MANGDTFTTWLGAISIMVLVLETVLMIEKLEFSETLEMGLVFQRERLVLSRNW